jgi:hypothetical protein
MVAHNPILITGAVEGSADDAALRAILRSQDAEASVIYGKNGKKFLQSHISGFNKSAVFTPWIVLVDLDNEYECAPELLENWLPNKSDRMCLRVVVREIESWLMGDRERIAKFLCVSENRIPTNPEAVTNPKQTLINIAKRSRCRDIRVDMVPKEGSKRIVGPAYDSRLIEFIIDKENGWRPERAALTCASLAKCLACIGKLISIG